jgi:hypothetical protein
VSTIEPTVPPAAAPVSAPATTPECGAHSKPRRPTDHPTHNSTALGSRCGPADYTSAGGTDNTTGSDEAHSRRPAPRTLHGALLCGIDSQPATAACNYTSCHQQSSRTRPNNRLQGMRGALHAFARRKGLRDGPAPLTLGALGRWAIIAAAALGLPSTSARYCHYLLGYEQTRPNCRDCGGQG